MILYGNMQCPFTKKFYKSLKLAFAEYPNDVALAFKVFPLPFHKQAIPTATAAMAAGRQGKYWEMVDLIFENNRALQEDPKLLERLAEELGLNMKKFKKDLKSKKIKKQIEQEIEEGKKIGVNGTPFTVVGAQFITGAKPYDHLKEIVKAEIEAAKK